MLWSPAGAAVAITNAATAFNSAGKPGVAMIANVTLDTLGTFTLGGSGVTNATAIPVPVGCVLYVAYGESDTHAIAAANSVLRITPGVGRP